MILLLKKISNILITIILFLITIIFLKSSSSFKNWFTKNVLDNNISFVKIASKYESLFGSPIPFLKLDNLPVFSEKLNYSSKEEYDDGVLLKVDNNLIPSLTKGLVIFIGDKDSKKCVIVEGNDYDISYCMLVNIGVKLYDHVDAGTYIGEVNENLILYFIKNGEYLNYEDFI